MIELDMATICAKIIPAILIFCIVFFNIRKMQKRAQMMRQEHSCGGGCAGCAHSAGCSSAKKEEIIEKK